jgi:hypothetical protein
MPRLHADHMPHNAAQARLADIARPTEEQNYQDILYIICLTRRPLLPPQALVDEPAQLTKPIGPEEGSSGTDRNDKIGLQNVGPLYRQRA